MDDLPALPEGPRALTCAGALEDRVALLSTPHHAPLSRFVQELRAHLHERHVDVPHLDPLGGGTDARVLYLLEAPGPKAARQHGGSGFVSMDNNDPTAEALYHATLAAGLERRAVVTWNIVPWYVGTGTSIRAVRTDEVREGRAHLRTLIAHLPALRVVVTFGRPATTGWAGVAAHFTHLTGLSTWHASGRALNGHQGRKDHLLDTLRLARTLAEHERPDARLAALLEAHRNDPRAPSW